MKKTILQNSWGYRTDIDPVVEPISKQNKSFVRRVAVMLVEAGGEKYEKDLTHVEVHLWMRDSEGVGVSVPLLQILKEYIDASGLSDGAIRVLKADFRKALAYVPIHRRKVKALEKEAKRLRKVDGVK